MRRSARYSLVILVALAALAASSTAQAVFPGVPGKIVFVQGQVGEPDDLGADVYILSGPNGNATPLDTRPGQHRHPAWSPNLKQVAYALWNTAQNEKIWVHDIATGDTDRLGPHDSNVRDDRPSWSPSGKRIAYESEVTDGSNQMDILIADISNVTTGAPILNLTDTPNFIEGKPVFSPDGKWIYYSRRPMPPNFDDDILRELSNGQGIPEAVINSATAEYQAALSPDGKRMCYTRGAFGTAAADIYVLEVDAFDAGYDLSDTTLGAYNCAWSPDGELIAYVVGTFTSGALMYEKADDSGSAQLLTTDTPNHFDGNPDWAPLRAAFCKGKPLTKAGTGGADTISGTANRDVIAAFGGNDLVKTRAGNDLVCAGKGNDRVFGGRDNDAIYGDAGNDRLDGDAGRDTCVGGQGSDIRIECEKS